MVNSSSIVREVIQAARRVIFSLCTTAVLERGFGGVIMALIFCFFSQKIEAPWNPQLIFHKMFSWMPIIYIAQLFLPAFPSSVLFLCSATATFWMHHACPPPKHRKKLRVAWYWNLRNENPLLLQEYYWYYLACNTLFLVYQVLFLFLFLSVSLKTRCTQSWVREASKI